MTGKTGREGLGNGFMKVFGATVHESPEALPVWAHARGVFYGQSVYPPKDSPLPDAITGATPAATQLRYYYRVPETHGDALRLLVELNVSLDGIPSMVYEAVLPLDSPGAAIEFVCLGYGDSEGRNGNITPADDMAGQAAELLASARAELLVKSTEDLLAATAGHSQPPAAAATSSDPRHILYGFISFGCVVIAVALIALRHSLPTRARPYVRSFHAVLAVSALLLMVMHVNLQWREPLGLASAALLVLLSTSYAIEPLRRFKTVRWMHRVGGCLLLVLILAHAVKALWFSAG